MCGPGLACLCRVICPRAGSGRGAALGGCFLGCLGVVFRGAMCYHEALCGGTECCGALCSGGLGWPFGVAWWPGLGLASEAWHGRAWLVPRMGWAWGLVGELCTPSCA